MCHIIYTNHEKGIMFFQLYCHASLGILENRNPICPKRDHPLCHSILKEPTMASNECDYGFFQGTSPIALNQAEQTK